MGINERRVAVASIAKLIPSNPQALANPFAGEEGIPPYLKSLLNPPFVKGGLEGPRGERRGKVSRSEPQAREVANPPGPLQTPLRRGGDGLRPP